MIRDEKECVRALLTLARQTKNYICENDFLFEMDINSMTDDFKNHKVEDINYLIDRVSTSLLEDNDKRAALRLTQLNEIQVFVEKEK